MPNTTAFDLLTNSSAVEVFVTAYNPVPPDPATLE